MFVVTVHNNAALLDRCLRSVANQSYENVRCVVVDDASEDDTAAVAAQWGNERPEVFTTHVTTRRRGKMANFYDAIQDVSPHEVVVELDGDDELVTADASADLARLHMRLDLVWTQHQVARHQWTSWPHFRSTDLPPAYRFRADLPRMPWTRSWHPSHLRSFKAWAFQRIERDDLMLDGQWVQASPDFTYFTPLVEMTPPTLRYFYDRELAIYNITASNEKLRDHESPPIFRQSYVVEQILKRPAYRARSGPLWVGKVDSTTRSAIEQISLDELRKEPATRFLLAAEHPIPSSWHPRVQILGQYTIAPSEATAAERHRTAMQWLTEYATELGYHERKDRQPYLHVSLRQFGM